MQGSRFVTTGWQWHCDKPDGSECDGSNGGFDIDREYIFGTAKRHKRSNPTHRVVIDRMARCQLD